MKVISIKKEKMKIYDLFKRADDVYISFGTENVERRDAEPFYSFDTDVPKVQPLWAKEEEFEIYERPIGENQEEYVVDEQPRIEFRFEEPRTLLLAAGEPRKLLSAGRRPLLLAAPEELTQTIAEILGGETQHVIYFSDVEFRNGVETVVEDRIVREKRRSFLGAKIISAIMMIIGLAAILFPSASLRAAKVSYEVNPTNTAPGLSFSIENNDMTVADGKGNLSIQTQPNQLVTSTLDLDVSTTGADGYKLYVTTSGKDKQGDYTNALVNKDVTGADGRGAKIQSLASDSAKSAFPAGYWGYTTAPSVQDNTMFKAFPVYDATDEEKLGGVEIASANTAVADEDAAGETPFTIGIKADENLPAGDYANELLFTVIVNPVTITYNLSFNGNTEDDSLADMPEMVTVASADVFRNVAIPAGVPTRDKYAFVGWADTADATEAAYAPGDEVLMQVANINDSQIVNKTLYAVWEELPDDTKYLQNFNDAIDLRTVGDSDIYVDKRDGTEYTVKRLPDGKVWMTQNLRYMGTATDPGTNPVTSGSFTTDANSQVPNTAITVSTSAIYSTSQTGAYYYGNTSYGAYYDWTAAHAVCPAGWHLPSSSESNALDSAYGYAGRNRDSSGSTHGSVYQSYASIESEINNYTSTSGNWPGYTPNGELFQGNLTGAGNTMLLWLSDGDGFNSNAFIHYNRSGSSRRLFYTNYNDMLVKTYGDFGVGVRCVGDQPNSFYLQDFDESKMLPNTGDSATLTDRRDGATYTVKRLADGKVWMTQNLRYAEGAKLVSSNVDYGGYYDWETSQTICPTGWHQPLATDFQKIVQLAGGSGSGQIVNSTVFSTLMSTTGSNPGYTMSGLPTYPYTGGVIQAGTVGGWWTPDTVENNTSNGYLFFMVKSQNRIDVYHANNSPKTQSMSVRCIADDDAKVTFNANGGEGTMAVQSFTRKTAQAIAANQFTRAGYKFVGWALSADAGVPKYTDQESVRFSVATTLYAVWKPNYLQDFDAKTALLEVGDTATLVDKRDTATYTVKRLADGKVWMTQNLAYATGATITPNTRGGYYSWNVAQTVCPAGWHLPAASEYAGMYDKYQSVSTFTTDGPRLGLDGRWRVTVNAYQYVDSAGYYWNSTNEDEAFSFNSDGQVWLTYTYLSTSYSNQVRCIANETETVSFDANGGAGEMADVTVEKGDTVTLTNSFTNSAYNFVGWATSADGEKVYDDGATITPTEDMTLYALWTPKGEFMQDFNQDTELLTVGSTKTLYDERDGNIYTVRRLADGKVWMVKDLDFTDNGKYRTSDYGAVYTWDNAQSVCPAGWHIVDKTEVRSLDIAWGGTGEGGKNSSTYQYFLGMDYLNLIQVGRYSHTKNAFEYVGLRAYYWTGNEFATDSTKGNNLYVNSLNDSNQVEFYDKNGSDKRNEQPVRCVADYQEYTVSFNANGGTGTVASPITKVVGQSLTLPTNTLKRTDYKFLGWATSASATTPEYTDGEAITVMEDMTLYAVWETIVAFTSNNLTWTKVLGDAPFSSASTLCPSGYHIPTRAQLRALIGASSDGVWVSGSMVNYLYNIWNQPHMVWSSDVYNSTGAYDLFFRDGQAIITATSTPSSPAQVVCVK